jgi:hypothetical protein
MVIHGLQIRFQLNIRFGYRISACDPDWTIFSSLKEKTQLPAIFCKKQFLEVFRSPCEFLAAGAEFDYIVQILAVFSV